MQACKMYNYDLPILKNQDSLIQIHWSSQRGFPQKQSQSCLWVVKQGGWEPETKMAFSSLSLWLTGACYYRIFGGDLADAFGSSCWVM